MKEKRTQDKHFTLIELLVVIAIIGILLSILMPSLKNAKEASKFVVCKSNQSQHGMLVMAAVKDNKGRIPRLNNFGDSNNPATDLNFIDHDWYGAQSATFTMRNPTMGLYTNNFDILRCPALNVGTKGSQVGSNGSYDYSLTGAFSIAFIAGIETTSRWGTTWDTGRIVPTPLILDEETNSINGQNAEVAFCQTDRFDVRHIIGQRKGSYGSIDGSVFTYVDPNANDYRSFKTFYSGLPNGRYDQLKGQTPAHALPGDSRVWQRRDGIGNQ
ncbi:MAG: type II secretion system GspH family protein [Lentisphaeraceae bacterium]|nr:type II secretion system GspH family protein [Lentisphaeraceae bacterium]